MSDSSKRGLGAMDPQDAREIQSAGGSASPQNFKKNRKLAREAGSKGGRARRGNRDTGRRNSDSN